MKNTIKTSCICMLFLLIGTTAHASFFNDHNSHILHNTDAGLVLRNNQLYYIENTEVNICSSTPCESGLRVAEGDTVYLYIPYGKTLRVQGGTGNGIYPAGAGIEVPENSVLYVLGAGVLYAKGGTAGRGSRGQDGTEGGYSIPILGQYYGGNGGAGGNGGGGAGAGIGGKGGEGGRGGQGVEGPKRQRVPSDTGHDGYAGYPGGDSHNGANCGKVYIVGSMTVFPASGDTCAKWETSAIGWPTEKKSGGWFSNDYAAGGGGGGGNGNNGLLAQPIGGGGQGAAGAGAGSSGALTTFYRVDGSKLLKELIKKVSQVVVDAIYTAITRDPRGVIAIVEIPGLDIKFNITPGKVTSAFLGKILHLDFTPVQINGGGGQGSVNTETPADRVNGLGFYAGEFHLSTIAGDKIDIYPHEGALMGSFGQKGSLKLAMQSTYCNVIGQDIEYFEKGKYPPELIRALTFDLSFDTTGVDITQPMPANRSIVYSDSLPQKVTVPTPRTAALFRGYRDGRGRYWYDDQGQVIPNIKDTKGQDQALYIEPGNTTLYPQWSNFYVTVIRHWGERAQHEVAQVNGIDTSRYDVVNYDIRFTLAKPSEQSAQLHTVARPMPHFHLLSPTEQTITMSKTDSLYLVDYFYNRDSFQLAWSVPQGTLIIDSVYSHAAKLPFGQPLRAPQYVVNQQDNGYYLLKGWTENDSTIVHIDTMPARDVTYKAFLERVPVAISYHNDTNMGTFVAAKPYLGTHILFQVQPKPEFEVDTCFATYFSPYGLGTYAVRKTEQGQAIYASLLADSIAVDIRYHGRQHTLTYTESTSMRISKMTLFINGDSITNDGGVDKQLPIRYGDEVGIRPEHKDDYVCTQLSVVTASGQVVPVEYREQYTREDKYEFAYFFTAPNENVTAIATYRVLDQNQVEMKMTAPDFTVRAFSNRGVQLDNQFLLDDGVIIEPGQLVWFEAENKKDTIYDVEVNVDNSNFVVDVRRQVFVHRDSTERDSTVAPKTYYRFALIIPTSTMQFIHIRFITKNNWADVPQVEATDPRKNGHYYDLLGNDWGTDNHLPAGYYIHNGQTIYIYQ